MIYQIETNNIIAQKIVELLYYLHWVRPVAQADPAISADSIATQIVDGYKEVQRIKASGEKPRSAFDLLAELQTEK